ncbi:MAG: 3-hydroxyacyl-CoA dehydrogenase NAD-binding domain-containing protein, partial [Candidatus Heimdallarchaeota archaeon]|nr:3-hydroxyacyl-CoA dehydrogenase NAD-binding domain-containing protein [Candidatus Heimdallarchaeota archaeon]
ISQDFILNGLEKNKQWLNRQVEKNKMTQEEVNDIIARMKGEIDLPTAVQDVDLVIEAIIENMEIKNKTWKIIGSNAPDHAIFGSNTSSLSITEMAKASDRPTEFLGIHFFNPPVIMNIIEFIKGYDTSESTLEKAISFGKSLDMNTVIANESPGFIVNRLLIPQLNEAYYALQEGVATVEDIDIAMKIGLNHPMGPLKLSDFIGLDTILFIAEYLHQELGEKFRPCPLLKKMVKSGKLGVKTGEGFYKY